MVFLICLLVLAICSLSLILFALFVAGCDLVHPGHLETTLLGKVPVHRLENFPAARNLVLAVPGS